MKSVVGSSRSSCGASFFCVLLVTCFFQLFFINEVASNCGKGDEKVEILIWSGGSWSGQLHGEFFSTPNLLVIQLTKVMNQ